MRESHGESCQNLQFRRVDGLRFAKKTFGQACTEELFVCFTKVWDSHMRIPSGILLNAAVGSEQYDNFSFYLFLVLRQTRAVINALLITLEQDVWRWQDVVSSDDKVADDAPRYDIWLF